MGTVKYVIEIEDKGNPDYWMKDKDYCWLIEDILESSVDARMIAIIEDKDWPRVAELVENIAEERYGRTTKYHFEKKKRTFETLTYNKTLKG